MYRETRIHTHSIYNIYTTSVLLVSINTISLYKNTKTDIQVIEL